MSRRVAKELRDSGVDRFIQPGAFGGRFSRPPFQTGIDVPYESYEANILWDQEEELEGTSGRASSEREGVLADSTTEPSSAGQAPDGVSPGKQADL